MQDEVAVAEACGAEGHRRDVELGQVWAAGHVGAAGLTGQSRKVQPARGGHACCLPSRDGFRKTPGTDRKLAPWSRAGQVRIPPPHSLHRA